MTPNNCPMEIRRAVHRRLFIAGFTLVEIMIVIAIIGILTAVAIPWFADYRRKGHNSAALSDLRNVKTILEAYHEENEHYP